MAASINMRPDLFKVSCACFPWLCYSCPDPVDVCDADIPLRRAAWSLDARQCSAGCILQAAVLGVPFVDVIATMSDPTLPATVTEYEVLALTLLDSAATS